MTAPVGFDLSRRPVSGHDHYCVEGDHRYRHAGVCRHAWAWPCGGGHEVHDPVAIQELHGVQGRME